jgi:hypothetical protein
VRLTAIFSRNIFELIFPSIDSLQCLLPCERMKHEN